MLGADGHVAEQGTFQYLKSQDGFVNDLKVVEKSQPGETETGAKSAAKKVSPATAKALKGPTANDLADLTRRTGDISVYRYYAVSIGWKIGLIVVVLVVAFSATSNFTRE